MKKLVLLLLLLLVGCSGTEYVYETVECVLLEKEYSRRVDEFFNHQPEQFHVWIDCPTIGKTIEGSAEEWFYLKYDEGDKVSCTFRLIREGRWRWSECK